MSGPLRSRVLRYPQLRLLSKNGSLSDSAFTRSPPRFQEPPGGTRSRTRSCRRRTSPRFAASRGRRSTSSVGIVCSRARSRPARSNRFWRPCPGVGPAKSPSSIQRSERGIRSPPSLERRILEFAGLIAATGWSRHRRRSVRCRADRETKLPESRRRTGPVTAAFRHARPGRRSGVRDRSGKQSPPGSG
jgi:hypothetical protein